jgi:hypothetical protein
VTVTASSLTATVVFLKVGIKFPTQHSCTTRQQRRVRFRRRRRRRRRWSSLPSSSPASK